MLFRSFKFNTNHYPIEDYFAAPIISDGPGKSKVGKLELVFKDHKDNFAATCQMPAN